MFTLDQQAATGWAYTMRQWQDVKPGDVVLLQGGLVEITAEGQPDPLPEEIIRWRFRLLSNGAEAELAFDRRWLTAVRMDLAALERQQQEATEAKVRIANAVGEMPYKQWPVLAAKVELRLAEQDATIERLRSQLLEATGTALMDEVPLPGEASDGRHPRSRPRRGQSPQGQEGQGHRAPQHHRHRQARGSHQGLRGVRAARGWLLQDTEDTGY